MDQPNEEEDDALSDVKSKKKKNPEDIEKEAHEILDHVSSGVIDTVKDRVAYILNNVSDARNSDVELVWSYWETFESDKFSGHSITKDEYCNLTKERSLIRWRAKIQNEYKLFQADDIVKEYRGVLEEGARQDAIDDKPAGLPNTTVYIDETGKTQEFLCVGSLWIPDSGSDVIQIKSDINKWQHENGIKYEFHFSELSKAKLERYKEFFTKFLSLHPTSGFKIIVVKNSGLGDLARPIVDLTFHLLDRGIAHENTTGRAPLPRLLQVWMDEDEVGRDSLKIANIKERIKAQQIPGLFLDNIYAVNSESNYHIQAVDLFTGAVNRVLHNEPTGHHKDELAEFILRSTRMSIDDIDLDNTDIDRAKVFNLSGFNQ